MPPMGWLGLRPRSHTDTKGRRLMFDLIARVLAWFYDFSSSYAISIVLLTFLIMLVLTPYVSYTHLRAHET